MRWKRPRTTRSDVYSCVTRRCRRTVACMSVCPSHVCLCIGCMSVCMHAVAAAAICRMSVAHSACRMSVCMHAVCRMLRRSGQHVASCSLCGVAWFVLHVAQRRLRLRCVQLERIMRDLSHTPGGDMSAAAIWIHLQSAEKLASMIENARVTQQYGLLHEVLRMSAVCPVPVPRVRQSLRMLRHSCRSYSNCTPTNFPTGS
jgi:hypothetical protein